MVGGIDSWAKNMKLKYLNISMETPNGVTPTGFEMQEYALGRLIFDKK